MSKNSAAMWTDMDDRSEAWDLTSRFDLNGDFRSRVDFYNADTVFGRDLDNDTIWTNRFRLNMRVGVTENVDFKGRLAMYKTWGDQSAFTELIPVRCIRFLMAMSPELLARAAPCMLTVPSSTGII